MVSTLCDEDPSTLHVVRNDLVLYVLSVLVCAMYIVRGLQEKKEGVKAFMLLVSLYGNVRSNRKFSTLY